jgi:predicted dehydrogenase
MVAENYRYSPLYLKVRDIIREGGIGELYGAFWNIFRRLDENNKYAKTAWRINHQYEGGFVTDAGIHNIAALRMICGEFSSGIATVESINPSIGKMDSMSFLFATTEMVKGVFNMYYSVNGYTEDRLLLIGTEGSIIVEDGKRITVKKQGEEDLVTEIPESGGYFEEFVNFYDAVRGGGKVVSTFHEAYMDLMVMLGAIHSAESKSV